MAVMAAWAALVMPIWKGWKHLTEGGSLARRRDSAMRRSVLALLLLATFIGLVPLPFRSLHQAVVWVPDEALVRAEAAGHVLQTVAAPGQPLQAGASVALLHNPQLIADVGLAASAVATTQAQLRRAEVDNKPRTEVLRGELTARSEKLVELQRRAQALDLQTSLSGRWVPKADTSLDGRYIKRGEVVGFVVGGPSSVVRTAIPQEDMDLIRGRLQAVQVRLSNDLALPIDATLTRQVPGGEFELVSQALGTAGGGDIVVDPSKPGGTHTLQRVFDLELKLLQPSTVSAFGDRAYVRFDLGLAPLGWQWFLRLRQLFLAHMNV